MQFHAVENNTVNIHVYTATSGRDRGFIDWASHQCCSHPKHVWHFSSQNTEPALRQWARAPLLTPYTHWHTHIHAHTHTHTHKHTRTRTHTHTHTNIHTQTRAHTHMQTRRTFGAIAYARWGAFFALNTWTWAVLIRALPQLSTTGGVVFINAVLEKFNYYETT